MKIFKKALALVMLIIMIANISVFAISFSDVTAGIEAERYISAMAEKGIIKGVGENSFAPGASCTREQFLTFLWRAENCPEPKKASTFTDITGEEYFSKAVSWAYENGITKIYSDGSFGVGKAIDREHACFYLYNYAKFFNKADITKTVSLNDYSDRGNISLDSVLPIAWALDFGILSPEADGTLNPKGEINRAFAATAIGKLLEYHMHDWSEWEDLGNGTHKRVCLSDASHTEEGAHIFNDGELTIAPTDTTKGLITYTCKCCLLTKTEEVKPGTEIVTRKDLEDAVVSVATAYHVKGPKVQYDSRDFTDSVSYKGGAIRLTTDGTPEYATEDFTYYSVCSHYTYVAYTNSIDAPFMNGIALPYGVATYDLFRLADNQPESQRIAGKINDPLTENDVDSAIMRWTNFDAAKEYFGESRMIDFMSTGMFESTAFTDYTEGITFRDDGFEGEFHYSYYDKDGNLLDYNDVRDNYYQPLILDYENTLRPGDIIEIQNHAMLYVGNDRILDCAGYKVNTSTGEDQIEEEGAVFSQMPGWWPSSAKLNTGMLIVIRPTLFLAEEGFDDDPGNDIAPDVKIFDSAKTRIKYPAMDIDRTVDISPFGTVAQGENITYTVKITNNTNCEFYTDHLCTPNANTPYENIMVTETIPEGAEFVESSIVGGGEYKDGKITWNVAYIAPGETATLSYTVKAVGEIGSYIVNDGGMVDNIPSNVITNKIGSEKLSDEAKTSLAAIENLESYGSDTDFAEAIYSTIGEELSLPTAAEIAENVFTVENYLPDRTFIIRVPVTAPASMFRHQSEVKAEYKDINQMLINKYWGGRRFLSSKETMWEQADNVIKEFKQGQLEAGDIIVSVMAKDKNNLTYDFENINVYVYDGSRLLCSRKTPEGVTYEIIANENLVTELTKLYMTDKHLFFALRPSQVER